jgi:hypothetical protein
MSCSESEIKEKITRAKTIATSRNGAKHASFFAAKAKTDTDSDIDVEDDDIEIEDDEVEDDDDIEIEGDYANDEVEVEDGDADIEAEDAEEEDAGGDEGAGRGDGEDAVEVEVGPADGRKTRLVICMHAGTERHRHTFNTDNADQRTKFVATVAQKLELLPENLSHLDGQMIEKADAADEAVAKAAAEQKAQAAAPAGNRAAEISAKALADTPKEIITAATRFLKNPDLFDELKRDVEALGVVGEHLLAQAVYLVGTSRIMVKPLGGLVQAASSTGKSFVSNTIVSLMPEEAVLKATDITGQALYYFSPGRLQHKFVCVAERKHQESPDDASAANASLALREMFSSGELRKVVTMKGDQGMTTEEIRQEGPIAYLETTTQSHIFSEDETRLMRLVADESKEQTQRILEQLKCDARGETGSEEEQRAIRLKHQTAQRLLQPLRVNIPYAQHLNIPATKVAARRAFGQLIGCIQTVALLRQFQKKVIDGGIAADLDDYRIAYKVMLPVLCRTFAPVSQRAIELLARINDNVDQQSRTFDRQDCVRWSGLSLTEVRDRLQVLVEASAITQDSGGKGQKCVYRIEKDIEGHDGKLRELVSPKKLEELICREDIVVD